VLFIAGQVVEGFGVVLFLTGANKAGGG